jgi:hypothetical protein
MYGQPARAFRRRQQDAQLSREIASYFGDGEAQLGRVAAYLEKELAYANPVRREGLKGALSVVRAATRRVIEELNGPIPF